MQEAADSHGQRTTFVSFTTGGIFRVLAVIAAALALWKLTNLVILILIAFIVASAIHPLAHFLEQRGVGRVWTVIAVFALILGAIAVLGVLTAPVVGTQLQQFATHIPEQTNRASQWLTARISRVTGHPVRPTEVSGQVGQSLRSMAMRTLEATPGAAGVIAQVILMIVLAAFMVIDHDRFRTGFLRFVPAGAREVAAKQWDEVQERMGGYVAGMALISVEKAIVITTGLWLIGVPSAVLLGLLAGVLNFVPYLGFWSVFLLAELLAFNASPLKGVWVFVMFVGHEWFKSGLLGPYLMGRTMKVHPAVVLVAIAAGTKLFGVAGTLVAAPLAAAVSVLVTNLLPAPTDAKTAEHAESQMPPHRLRIRWGAGRARRRPAK